MLIFLAVFLLILGAGILWESITGLYVAVAALTLAMGAQTLWLRLGALPVLAEVAVRDAASL